MSRETNQRVAAKVREIRQRIIEFEGLCKSLDIPRDELVSEVMRGVISELLPEIKHPEAPDLPLAAAAEPLLTEADIRRIVRDEIDKGQEALTLRGNGHEKKLRLDVDGTPRFYDTKG